jgi:TonB family protein
MCNVIFDTTPYGFVRNVRADCTDPVFKANAMAAIARTAFPPAVSENKAVARHDVAYTLNFGLGPHALDAPGSYGKRACDMSVNGCEDADAPRADRDAQPIAPPRPVYPEAAVNEAKSGSCNVVVDVTAEGYPINVMAKCSDPVFVNSAKTAVEAVRFVPKVVDGQAVPRTGVVYPLEYRFE